MTAWHRLTAAMDLAALRRDEPAWRVAFQRREALGISLARCPEFASWRSPYRCQCCGRLEWSGVCEDAKERSAAA